MRIKIPAIILFIYIVNTSINIIYSKDFNIDLEINNKLYFYTYIKTSIYLNSDKEPMVSNESIYGTKVVVDSKDSATIRFTMGIETNNGVTITSKWSTEDIPRTKVYSPRTKLLIYSGASYGSGFSEYKKIKKIEGEVIYYKISGLIIAIPNKIITSTCYYNDGYIVTDFYIVTFDNYNDIKSFIDKNHIKFLIQTLNDFYN